MQPRIIVFAVERSELAARIILELRRAGCQVAGILPFGHLAAKIGAVEKRYVLKPFARLLSLVWAIDDWSPSFIVVTDDAALEILQRLHSSTRNTSDARASRIAQLIETSIGDPQHFSSVQKSALMAFAPEIGIRCPKTRVVTNARSLAEILGTTTYPTVLKVDGMSGGAGVRIVRNERQAWKSFSKLTKLTRARSRRFGWVGPAEPKVMVQEYIDGRPANRAMFCWKGKVLAGISAEAIQVSRETGPSTVIRVIHHSQMSAIAARLVERMGISGFCGFDFMIDNAGDAVLIEINARAVPTAHLVYAGGDLFEALLQQITGMPRRRPVMPIENATIALFPHEWLRNPASVYLRTAYHDVPWDTPTFVGACMAMRPDKNKRNWLQNLIHRYRKLSSGTMNQQPFEYKQRV